MKSTGRAGLRPIITTRSAITVVLILQVLTLPLFPPESFAGNSQEWWLPILLMLMVVIADVELIVQHSNKTWPWDLISFANGFNILSRLMMVWSHATLASKGSDLPNIPYILLTVISLAISSSILVYTEWPEVRMGLLKTLKPTTKSA